MKALLIKAFNYLFRRKTCNWGEQHFPETAPDQNQKLDFARLKGPEQEAVKQYFAAAQNLMQTIKSIKEYRRAVAVEQVLDAFERAERSYHWYNMRPIFPPALRLVSSFDAGRLIELGLMARSSDMEKVVMYAPAMRAYVTRLKTKSRPSELDSRAPRTPA